MDYDFYSKHYGKKYAEFVKDFCEYKIPERLDFIESIDDTIIEKYQKGVIKRCLEYAYSDGLKDGLNYYEELSKDESTMKVSPYIMNKDFTIMFDFHDNDFGGYLSDAISGFVKKYNDKIKYINSLYDEECKLGGTLISETQLKELEDMESIQSLIDYLIPSFIVSYINSRIYYKNYDIDDLVKEGKKDIKYLGIEDISEYKIGTYEEIEKYVVEKYADQQFKDWNKTLEKCWLNGEVLFVSMRNGKMKAWIQ